MKYTNGLDFKPEELGYCVDVSQLKIKIVKGEVFLEDETAYLYLEGISDKVLKAIMNKMSLLRICHKIPD